MLHNTKAAAERGTGRLLPLELAFARRSQENASVDSLKAMSNAAEMPHGTPRRPGANGGEKRRDPEPEAPLCGLHGCRLVTVQWCPVCRGSSGGRSRSVRKVRAVRRNGRRGRLLAEARRYDHVEQYLKAEAPQWLAEIEVLMLQLREAGDLRGVARLAVARAKVLGIASARRIPY